MSENSSKTILVIGTFDTKNDELFLLSLRVKLLEVSKPVLSDHLLL